MQGALFETDTVDRPRTSLPTVVVVDDHVMLAESVARELERREIARPVVIDPTQTDALDHFLDSEPEACLIDLDLGHRQALGLKFVEKASENNIRSAMFTGANDRATLGRCLQAGAVGVISKAQGFEQVIERIARLLAGEPVNSASELLDWVVGAQRDQAQRRKDVEPFFRLTERERAVLDHLVDGLSVNEIADAEYVSVATVRSHVRAILNKLDVHSQLASVSLARHVGWRPDRRSND